MLQPEDMEEVSDNKTSTGLMNASLLLVHPCLTAEDGCWSMLKASVGEFLRALGKPDNHVLLTSTKWRGFGSAQSAKIQKSKSCTCMTTNREFRNTFASLDSIL